MLGNGADGCSKAVEERTYFYHPDGGNECKVVSGLRTWFPAAAIAVAALLLTACGAGPSRLASSGSQRNMAGTFVAISAVGTGQPHLERFSLPPGCPLGPIRAAPSGPQLLSSVVSSSGQIWVATPSGPCLRDGTVGGDPAPNRCR